MEGTKYKTKEEILKRAQSAIGIPLGKIDQTGRLRTGKGAIGTVLEESWFGYTPNSEAEPDFPEAGVELKATPYLRTKNGIRAKERLVCNIINYMTEYQKTFETSDFWHKCETLLIMSYEHKPNQPKSDFTIDKAILFSYPTEDLIIIEQDWQKIMAKIRAGKAHLITEGDTLYLAACTKGANASSVRKQPFSDIPAMQRAYSLKSSYMTRILNYYIFGSREDEHIIKDWTVLTEKTFEQIIIEKLRPHYGETVSRLAAYYNLLTGAKNTNERLLSKMLGVEGRVSQTSEFLNANIVPKTIRVQKTGKIKESMSFPTFRFTEIIQEDWETSELREMLEPTKFMFVIFQENSYGEYVFQRVFFWNIPRDDLEEVRKVWERTVEIIKRGVELHYDGNVVRNNLPKQSESRVAHVRPHARDSRDTYPLPDGRRMPKQCFWLNRTYIESVVNNAKEENISFKSSIERSRFPKNQTEEKKGTHKPAVREKSKAISYPVATSSFVPCGAHVYHRMYGEGQVYRIYIRFSGEGSGYYPYLSSVHKELTISSDGRTVYHERFGKGEIVMYGVTYESKDTVYSPEKFWKELKIINTEGK